MLFLIYQNIPISTEENIMNNKRETIIIAGGGTGGHIIPAVSIALELKEFDSIYIG